MVGLYGEGELEDLGVEAFGDDQFSNSCEGDEVYTQRDEVDHNPARSWRGYDDVLLDFLDNPVEGEVSDNKVGTQVVKFDILWRE